MPVEISPKQKEVYLFLISFVEQNGYQPSLRQMASHFGVDKRAIWDRLQLLMEKGLVSQGEDWEDRALRLPYVRFRAEVGSVPKERPKGPRSKR